MSDLKPGDSPLRAHAPRLARLRLLAALATVPSHRGVCSFLPGSAPVLACQIPTGKYGERLKDQVEERLRFYDSGEAPRKNIDVMKEVIAELQAEGGGGGGGDDDKAAKKAKKAEKEAKKAAKEVKKASKGEAGEKRKAEDGEASAKKKAAKEAAAVKAAEHHKGAHQGDPDQRQRLGGKV